MADRTRARGSANSIPARPSFRASPATAAATVSEKSMSRETGGRAPTAQLRTGTTSPEAPEGEGTKTGGHDRNDG